MSRNCLFVLFFLVPAMLSAQNRVVKVHFLYGSKPKKAFKSIEKQWFGSIHSRHVGLSLDTSIVSFVPIGKARWFARRDSLRSRFVTQSLPEFNAIFDQRLDASVRYACVEIPITDEQYQTLQLVIFKYLNRTPYDYAFVGMRCAAAAYDILAQAGIMKPMNRNRTVMRIFYPKKLRKRLFRLAKENHYKVTFREGRDTRRWEKN